MSTRLHTLQVELTQVSADRSYPIIIGQDLLQDAALFHELLADRPVVLVSNDTIAPQYAARVCDALGEARRITQIMLPDGEIHKNLENIDRILSAALADKHERRTVFIALGGGVVGDMTGFAAACFLRGADFIQLPTTLLAQVDSSVGGKTGVNHAAGKNLIGAFHQPLAVLIDLQTLHTLPAREFAAGIAEVIKYGCICDDSFFDWLTSGSVRLLAREDSMLAEAIERSCAIKARVVAADFASSFAERLFFLISKTCLP
jgi:3-dehydroquinate synthase